MTGLPGSDVVEHAALLSRQTPDRPALDILDEAMRARQGARLEPGIAASSALARADTYIDPPSPFAELLRRAFAPTMDPRDLALAQMKGKTDAPDLQPLVDAAADRWQAVLEMFAERYRLWEA